MSAIPVGRARVRPLTAAVVLCAAMLPGLVGCGAPAGTHAAATFPAGTTGVAIADLRYSPATLVVPVGTTVAWVNGEAAAHDVAADDGTFSSPTLQLGELWTRTFASTGAWTYHCTLHPEMAGTITVR